MRKYFVLLCICISAKAFSQAEKYCGLWLGYGYQCFTVTLPSNNLFFYSIPYELLLITPVDSEDIRAIKIIGDHCVPAGNISWGANVTTGAGYYTLGSPSQPAYTTVGNTFTFQDSNHISGTTAMYYVRLSCYQIDSMQFNIDSIYAAYGATCPSCPLKLVIPNIFTPNGDGINDLFFIPSDYVSKFNITIYNRWGDQVFYSFYRNFTWDGKKGDNLLPDGMYYYIVSYTDRTHKPKNINGFLTLIR